MSQAVERILLSEALPLIASYAFGASVELSTATAGVRSEGREDETELFIEEIRARHSLASVIRLRETLQEVERSVSMTAILQQRESLGLIRGRLNVPRYIAKRAASRSLPRRYPIVVTEQSPETSENVLVTRALRSLARDLARSPFPPGTAESLTLRSSAGWVRNRLRRWPWDSVRRPGHVQHLRREAALRVRKRQTGNEHGYSLFLDWLEEWEIHPKDLGSEQIERIVGGILAFPTGDAFWERTFEIWCLREMAECFERVGCERVSGPHALHRRGQGPIYTFRWESRSVELWFQRQKPLGSPRWAYSGRGPLTGIPDIIASVENAAPLVVDAKYREKTGVSDEIYKLLGYAENFRPAVLFGALLFPGSSSAGGTLDGPSGGSIGVAFMNVDGDRTKPRAMLDGIVAAWLAKSEFRLGGTDERSELAVAPGDHVI